jgi:hypothetical protein
MTRAAAALLHGELVRALGLNAGVWLVGLGAIGASGLLLLEIITGKPWVERIWSVRRVRTAVVATVLVTMTFAWAGNLATRFGHGTATRGSETESETLQR